MHSLFLALSATADPTPAGTLRPGLTEDQISPGIWGFLATAFVVVLSIFLIVDMVRRLRRVRYRTQVEEDVERENDERGPGEAERDEAERDEDSTQAEAGGEDLEEDHHEGHAANGAGNGSNRG